MSGSGKSPVKVGDLNPFVKRRPDENAIQLNERSGRPFEAERR
jgi:hypothetical protein